MGQGKKKAGKVYRTKKLSTPKSKADKKRDRSHGGFLVAMGTFVAACAWTLWGSIQKERENMQRSKEVRTRLASKPLVFSPHAACRMDCSLATCGDHPGVALFGNDPLLPIEAKGSCGVVSDERVTGCPRTRHLPANEAARHMTHTFRPHISKVDVLSALKNGRVNERKSDMDARPCPRYAIDDRHVQCVFADCYKDTPVVTVIDTKTNHPCGPC